MSEWMPTIRMVLQIFLNLTLVVIIAVVFYPLIIFWYASKHDWYTENTTLGECIDRIQNEDTQ